jgi:hypothetical protein
LDEEVFMVTPPKSGTSLALSHFTGELADLDLGDDSAMMPELLAFEKRMGRYVAAVETGTLLTRLISELQVAQRLIQTGAPELSDHLCQLKSAVAEIQEQLPIAELGCQSDARFQALLSALIDLRRALTESDPPQPSRIEASLLELTNRCQAVQRPEPPSLQIEDSSPLHDMVEAHLQQVRLVTERPYSTRASVGTEMRTINTRLIEIQDERTSPEANCAVLDAEFDGLMSRIARLTRQIAGLP